MPRLIGGELRVKIAQKIGFTSAGKELSHKTVYENITRTLIKPSAW
jgi:hypothetical protein